MFDKDGKDLGYKDDQNWWFNPSDPDAFRMSPIDADYPEHYFDIAGVPESGIDAYYKYVNWYYELITGKRLQSVIDFGCAGGWFLKRFHDRGYRVFGIEGSTAGYNRSCKKIPNNIMMADLRKPVTLIGQHYDMALCTEVAEHIPVPFHGTLLNSITSCADMVWWSSEPPATNRPHLHHVAEMPLEYWKKLFAFFGWQCYTLPDEVHTATYERGRCIFYNPPVASWKSPQS